MFIVHGNMDVLCNDPAIMMMFDVSVLREAHQREERPASRELQWHGQQRGGD